MSAQNMATAVGFLVVLSITPLAAQDKRTAAPRFDDTPTVDSFAVHFDQNRVPPPFDRSLGTFAFVAPRELRFAMQADTPPVKGEPPERANWIRKHPAKFGALIGAGIGTVPAFYEMATCPPTGSCSTAGAGVLFGAMTGAGIGAFTGWVISQLGFK